MKRSLIISIIPGALCALAALSAQASCDFGGIQKALRDGADKLHSGNPVKYIDFSNDAYFSVALDEMKSVGVSNAEVQSAWVRSLKEACGSKASRLRTSDVGPSQTLSGLANLLGVSE